MTDNNHPITPPPDLIEDWVEIAKPLPQRPPNPGELAALAARWGADQELEACILLMLEKGWMNQSFADNLRDARRPKPLSLKEQALQALDLLKVDASTHGLGFDSSAIRRALESLPE
jgi:hypothetical protein